MFSRPRRKRRNRDQDSISVLDAAAGETESNENAFNLGSELAFIRIASGIAATFLFIYFAGQITLSDEFAILAFAFFLVAAFQITNGFYSFWNFNKGIVLGEILFPGIIILSAIFAAVFSIFATGGLTINNAGSELFVQGPRVNNITFGPGLVGEATAPDSVLINYDVLEVPLNNSTIWIGDDITGLAKEISMPDCSNGVTIGVLEYEPIEQAYECLDVELGSYLSFTSPVVKVVELLAKEIVSFNYLSPKNGDSHRYQHKFPVDITITRISCSTDTGTTLVDIENRLESTPNITGIDVQTLPISCNGGTEITTAFDAPNFAPNEVLSIGMASVAGNPTGLRVHVEYIKDDV